MACCLFDTKSYSDVMLNYDLYEQIQFILFQNSNVQENADYIIAYGTATI